MIGGGWRERQKPDPLGPSGYGKELELNTEW